MPRWNDSPTPSESGRKAPPTLGRPSFEHFTNRPWQSRGLLRLRLGNCGSELARDTAHSDSRASSLPQPGF